MIAMEKTKKSGIGYEELRVNLTVLEFQIWWLGTLQKKWFYFNKFLKERALSMSFIDRWKLVKRPCDRSILTCLTTMRHLSVFDTESDRREFANEACHMIRMVQERTHSLPWLWFFFPWMIWRATLVLFINLCVCMFCLHVSLCTMCRALNSLELEV